MREGVIVLAFGSALIALANTGAWSALARPGPVSFERQIAPLLERECAFCHTSAEPYGGLSLEPDVAHEQIVRSPSSQSQLLRIRPGSPTKSYLYLKLTGEHRQAGSGTKMPPGWQSLSGDDLALIERWIRQGGKDN